MSKRISFSIVLALAFSVLLLFPRTVNAAMPPMPTHGTSPTTTTLFYAFTGIVTKGPDKGMFMNGGLKLQVKPSGQFTGKYYAPNSKGLSVAGLINQHTGAFDVSFERDTIHHMGPITGEGMLNKTQTLYNGEFQIANTSKKNDSGVWTGALVNAKSAIVLAFQSAVKQGQHKGMVAAGIIILNQKSMSGVLIQPDGSILPCSVKKSENGKQVQLVIGSNMISGIGKPMTAKQYKGYMGLFKGPYKGDQGMWEALFIGF